ncbi:peptidase C14 [Fusarium beomiforme]|uniref:Peptidase C14 n=1 Tax=Fusarium beomiforme TaxID=44412 RepID=A0A9P5DUD2_9HYPO|nr:peptidase C14 [Fusarium beomiforme]
MAHTGGVRLVRVHPHDHNTETDIDIIAIHGLDTRSPDTWIWKSHTSEKSNVNWLADPRMLPSRVGPARIFTCDWPADVLLRSDSIPMVLKEFARLLLAGIKTRPAATNGQTSEDRPILFIASCLGGIILAQALIIADNDYLSVRKSTRGIIFLATPFRGTSFQDVAIWAEPGLKAWAWTRGEKVTELLSNVEGPTFDLNELVRNFTQLCSNSSNHLRVFTFYELGKTNLFRKFPVIGTFLPFLKVLVDKSSASLDIVPDPLPLDRTHVMMNKFSAPEDPDYELVAMKLEEFLRTIRHGSPLERADDLIRQQYYNADRLKIERLSGQPLSIEDHFINLAIVERLGRNTDRSKQRNTAPRPSKSSLCAQLKVKTPTEEVQVELPALFSTCQGPDGPTTRQRRILIRGPAGVGKTTLCKKIVHDFYDHGMWKALFDRVLWVPLRKLKTRRDSQYNLGEFFYTEYFSQHMEGRDLANELWRALGKHGNRTLFILDGLDEVSQDLDRDGNMFPFFTQLWNQPNVIITSRPHAQFPAGLHALDLELEVRGFYPYQVKEYLQTAFDKDSKTVDEVQSFLHNHWLIRDLVRIPILLDVVCFTWDSSDSNTRPQTLTDIYKDIEQKLWKKDVLRLGKKADGERVTKEKTRFASPSEIESLVKSEIHFLEVLAFTGHYNDVQDFESRHRNAIYTLFNPPITTFLFDQTLPRLSFLRTSDPSSDYSNRSYNFLHKTFQEYFAARYFVQQWKAGKQLICLRLSDGKMKQIEPVAFIRKHKYISHYDVFWRFVAGLLDSNGDALCFFRTIEEEPRDLLGPTHQRLVMHCLSEVGPSNVQIRKGLGLEEKLLQWVLFECSYARGARLASEVEFPEQVLETALQKWSDETKKVVLRGITPRPRNRPIVIKLATSWLVADQTSEGLKMEVCSMLQRSHEDLSEAILQAVEEQLKDPRWYIKRAALDVLGCQPTLSEAILKSITARLGDQESHVRRSAVDTLRSQSSLPGAIVQAIVARLEDPEEDVRQAAVDVLGSQSTLPEAIFRSVIERLGSPKRYVRRAAMDVLYRQSTLPGAVLQAIVARLEDQEKDVRQAAVDALGRQPTLPEEIVRAIAAQLEDPEEDVRQAVLGALRRQSTLSEAILQSVVAGLNDSSPYVKMAAMDVFGCHSSLPEAILQAIMESLNDTEEDVRGAAVDALGSQSTLPEEILQAIVARLEDSDRYVRMAAMDALSGQSTLPESILQSVVERLEDPKRYVRRAAMDVLHRQSTLSKAILQAVALRLESENARDLAEDILRRHGEFYSTLVNGRFVKSLYRILLRRSFEEQVSWYVEDGSSCILMPGGCRRASLQNHQDQFMARIAEARPRDFPSMDGGSSNGM